MKKEDFDLKIKEVEKKIDETRERLLNILRPTYIKNYDELVKIKGGDLLFYGDCCKLEAKLHTLKECSKISVKPKGKVWRLIYPDGTESMMTYDPIEFEKEKAKKILEREKQIMKLHNLVVTGLVNGLTHTIWDGRRDDIDFWRRRCFLFNEFSHCVLNIVTNQTCEYSEKELKRIAREGYKK